MAALLVLAGCGAPPGDLAGEGNGIGPGSAGDPPADPAVVIGFATAAPAGAYTSVDAFELFTTTTIRVVADFADVDASASARLELRKPGGNVWYATVIPFTGATGSDRSVTVLPDGSRRVVYVLEVAGTLIETYQMVGSWIVKATLDGTPVSASGQFALY